MQTNILEYLEQAAKCYPDKTAYTDEERRLSFQVLQRLSKTIGTALVKKKMELHRPVAVLMRRSPWALAACFGIVYGGGCYAVLDEEMPKRRMQLVLEKLHPQFLICEEGTKAAAEELMGKSKILIWEEMASGEIEENQLLEIRRHVLETDPVYICFTSGSTGVPKGVVGTHRALINYVEQLSGVLGFDESCIFGNQTPLHVDACMKEIYGTLKCGGETWLIPKKLFLNPVKLVEYLNEHQINTICWVASALSMVSALGTFDLVRPKFLRLVTFGSETFPVKQLNAWRKALPDAEFYNLYGPTESTGVCCYYHVDRIFEEGEAVPAGLPFTNMDVFLLDEGGRAARKGEICVRGPGITKGYFGELEKTEEAFTQNPLCPDYKETIYHTGDLGYWGEDGLLYFLSRKDYQIKHMGHRIELGEIEQNANLQEGVYESCCVYVDTKIVLFYSGTIGKKELIKLLRLHLPQYMLPNAILMIDALPRLSNGKLDRKQMEQMYLAQRGKRKKTITMAKE